MKHGFDVVSVGVEYERTVMIRLCYEPRMADCIAESSDGTRLHLAVSGEGRSLLLVSGALFPEERWRPVLPALAAHHRVYILHRRGRGRSVESVPYGAMREVEDVVAAIAAVHAPVDVVGHSSGAILALQAAEQRPPALGRLIVYEPPVFSRAEDRIALDLPERLERLLAAGDREAAVETFLREGPRVSEPELTAARSGPSWARLVSELAHTVAYDARVQGEFVLDRERLGHMQTPTLVLIGSNSPARMRWGSEAIASALPNCRVESLAGQQHAAMLSAPAVFTQAVLRFIDEPADAAARTL